MFKTLQKMGKAFMLPIAMLPAAGLLLGIGGALSNPNTVMAYPILNQKILQIIFKIMAASGNTIFANLALLLCIGLAVGLAKSDKGVAALAALAGFLVMNATISEMINSINPEIKNIDTGVVGSIVIAFLVSFLHDKYKNIELPQFFGFFGGSRFVPIISSVVAIFVGALFFIVWPFFQNGLLLVGENIANLGIVGTFLYGFLLRLTGAIGLHHIIYPLFWYTELGGIENVAGVNIVGAQKIFFAQLADPNHIGLFTHGTRFFAGRFATMMFGLPGAALAMYRCADPKKRKLVAGILFSAALTSFLTGITEPIEFMFLFIAPWLYVLHAFFDGLSFLIADLVTIRIGNTFSGGFIDFMLFGVLQGESKTHWMYIIPIGIIWFFFYYFTFSYLIKKFNILTPGRENDDLAQNETEARETNKNAANDKNNITAVSEKIILFLGGKNNIQEVDACITRLRVSVVDSQKVNKEELKKLGAVGVLDVKGGIQAIFGGKSDLYKQKINEILKYND